MRPEHKRPTTEMTLDAVRVYWELEKWLEALSAGLTRQSVAPGLLPKAVENRASEPGTWFISAQKGQPPVSVPSGSKRERCEGA
jgi:hypothetical protein